MIKDIQELNFPSYATMSAATVLQPDMGEWNITSQIKIDGQIAPDFSFDWEVVHDGHKYIMPLRKPQGSKENTSLNSVIDLTFQHWAIWQLKRWPFVTMQPIDSGTAVADEEVATVSLNLGDLVILFAQVLKYYYGDKITIQLNPNWQYKAEAEVVTISHTKVWNVLIDTFQPKYGVRWVIEPNGSYDKYVIKVGYPTTEQSHIFEYGFQGGLMKVERQVQSEEICNLLKGRGGEKNLPAYYFKKAPDDSTFPSDPDWIEELANIYFSNLMPATFRSYVQGWKAAHISKYPGYTAVGEANAYAPWAYRKGFTDTKFHPVEFVADEITINPEAGDRQVEILPGYSPFVKKGSSLDKYGPLMNSLDNNEDIYPTIQGLTVDPYGRIDEAVAVEPITSDDIEEAAESDAQIATLPSAKSATLKVSNNARQTFTLNGELTVPQGKTANLITDLTVSARPQGSGASGTHQYPVTDGVIIEEYSVTLKNKSTGATHSASGIPAGSYTYQVTANVHNASGQDLNVTVSCPTPKLQSATPTDQWSNTWRVWVKNIWQTSKSGNETDAQYAERVWRPILGDREGNEAKVVFASGMLAHEDYEFTIVTTPKYERKLCKWQTVENGQVVEHEYWSEWCIELGKNDAELDTLGVYLPSVMRQGKAGDFFFFIGIDMPHLYTKWGEERVDNWKLDNLDDKSDIKPTWVVQTDRVRLNGEGKANALIRQLHPGDTLRLADKRFIEGDYETLYLSSLTKTYREPTSDDAALNPDVEIVLSDSYEVSANPVATLQGEVSALAKQVGSISNVEQIVRAVGDKLYLRKDGIADRSISPTEFASLLTSMGFRSGMVGGAGWGIYKDANGRWVIEADRFMAREDLEVNNLVINQVTGQGGTIVESAARMEITRVEDTTSGYKCYFDQHEGTVANLFHVDDIAWNNRFTPENSDLKFYRRRVTEVGADYVVLSKTDVNGTGIPAEGDVIVQRGNYTDANRQYIKVRDVIGGGYERFVGNLNSVDAEGVQYHFVGRTAGELPQWFTGERDLVPYSGEGDGSYIEFVNHKFNLNNVSLSIGSKVGDTTFGDILQSFDTSKYLREALNQSTDIVNGLVLTSAILLGKSTDLGRETWAGHNGLYNNPKTIASFWGGGMVDRFYDEDGNPRDPLLTSGYAASLVRMDGSAYFAKGNIGFEADGSGWLGNYENGIRFSTNGSMIFGSGIKINLNNSEAGLKETLESVLNFQNGLDILLKPCNAEGEEISWQEATQSDGAGGIKAKSLKSAVNFWADGDIVGLGYQSSSGGGNGGGFGLMREWPTSAPTNTTTDALGANLGWELKQRIDNLPTTSVNPYALTIQKNGTTLGSYDGSVAKTINISDVASAATLTSHIDNTTIHITAAERTLWNTTATNLSAILGSDTDNVINKYEEIVAFLATYTEADTLANLLGNKADKTTKISAGTGLTGGGTLAADRTLSLATSGVTAGTYTKLTVDAYGRATAGASLVASDIPSLDWSKITSGKPSTLAGYGITDAYTTSQADSKFLAKATFDDLFEKVVVNGITAIKAKYHFYALGDIAALGPVSPGGSSGGGATLLSELDDVLLTSPMAGHALVYNGTNWINQALNPGLDESALATYLAANQYARISDIPSLSGYAKETWVQSQGYALASSLSGYLPLTGGVVTGSTTFQSSGFGQHIDIFRNAGANAVIKFRNTTGLLGYLGFTYDKKPYYEDSDNNTFPLLHSGNYSSYALPLSGGTMSNTNLVSNLNADMLDGVHLSGLFRNMAMGNGDANNITTNGVYTTGASPTNTPANAQGHQLLHFNWDVNAANQLYLRYDADSMYFRRKAGNVWKDWKQFAFLDSNVASASKLATSRTLWGQNFDGTGNVSGNMTGVGSIQSTHGITSNAADVNTSVGTSAYWYGLSLNIDTTDNFVTLGGYYGLKLFTNNGMLTMLRSGYVGVGITPEYKLDVNGSMRALGLAYITNNSLTLTLGAQNNSGIHIYTSDTSKPFYFNSSAIAMVGNGTIGSSNYRAGNVYSVLGDFSGQVTAGSLKVGGSSGGLITWDATNNAFKFHGNLYATGDIAALGPTSSTGGASGGGGLIQSVYGWGDLGGTFNNSNLTDTFNAYTINKLYADKADKTWVEGKGYITSSALSNYVTLNTAQTITGVKTFSALGTKFADNTRGIIVYRNIRNKAGAIEILGANESWVAQSVEFENNGDVTFMNKIIKSGGTSSQFLKADGSVDSNAYALSSALANYLPLTGGTLTGTIKIATNSNEVEIGALNSAYIHYMSNGMTPHYFNNNVHVKGDFYAGSNYNQLVWHQGNDGNGSGLDADLLDGYHEGSFLRYRGTTSVNGENTLWSQIGIKQYNGALPDGLSDVYNWGEVISLSSPNARCEFYCSHQSSAENANGGLYYRSGWDADKKSWQRLATINSNVASATKLATTASYSAWGQTFFANGVPQSVSGDMTGVGSISMSGNIQLTSATGGFDQGLVITSKDYKLGFLIGTGNTNRGIYDYTNGGWLLYRDNTSNVLIPSGNVAIGKTTADYKLDVNGDIMANGWLRTTGNVGWYSQTHGGGWYMTESAWIRTYNGKSVYSGAGEIRSDNRFNRMGYLGDSWNKGYGAYNVEIRDNNRQTPIIVAYRGQDSAVEGANRLFALELLNSGGNLHFAFGGANKFEMTSGGKFYTKSLDVTGADADNLGSITTDYLSSFSIGTHASAGMCSVSGSSGSLALSAISNISVGAQGSITIAASMGSVTISSGMTNLVKVDANLQVTGDVVGNYSSDVRMKQNIRKAKDCIARLRALGPVIDFQYNRLANEKRPWTIGKGQQTSLVYQQAVEAGIPDVCHLGADGYGCVNLLSHSFLATLLGGVMEHETEIEKLRKKVKALEKEIKKLKEAN